jgi:hypothetical protein
MKLLAIMSLCACSFVTTSAPKAPPNPPSCSESFGSPALDLVGAVIGGPTLAFLAWALTEDNLTNRQSDTVIGLTMATTFVAFGASAVFGFSRVSRCKDAHGAYRGQMMMQQPYYAPPVYAPPVYAPPEPPAGTERGLCRADQTCDAGLTCASNRCVVLPAP